MFCDRRAGTFVGRHDMGVQAVICNRRSCEVIETPVQRSQEDPLERLSQWSKATQKTSKDVQKSRFGAAELNTSQANGTNPNFLATYPRQSAQRRSKRLPREPPKTPPATLKCFEGTQASDREIYPYAVITRLHKRSRYMHWDRQSEPMVMGEGWNRQS